MTWTKRPDTQPQEPVGWWRAEVKSLNRTQISLPMVLFVTPPSELVTRASAGIEVRGLVRAKRVGLAGIVGRGRKEAVGKTVRYLRPHHTGIHVHVPGEAPVDHQRDG